MFALSTVGLVSGPSRPGRVVAQAGVRQPAGRRTVWDGVYTEAQASRGQRQYGQSCEYCHGTDLGGNQADEVPALALEGFLTSWRGRSVKALFDRISQSMPHDKPASLSPRAYLDIVSYLLAANQFPSGKSELELAPERLEQILITKAPDPAGGQDQR
jgi:hypothetical protein